MSYEQQEVESSRLLPSPFYIRAQNPRASGEFKVEYDGGGEWVLWFQDNNGTQSGHYGKGVKRHIKTYTGAPAAEQARDDAVTWLNANAYWL